LGVSNYFIPVHMLQLLGACNKPQEQRGYNKAFALLKFSFGGLS